MSVMQLALEALDSDNPDIQLRAAIALREKLAQPEHDYRTRYDRGCYKCGSHYCPADCPDPTHLVSQQPLCTSPPKTEQEPVAWHSISPYGKLSNKFACKPTEGNWVEPLYTAPPKKEWVGLTEEERHSIREWQEIQKELGPVWAPMMLYLYLAIEQALKEKNHG